MRNTLKAKNDISGIINLYKPPNITSFKALDLIKKRFNAKKAGHCGTLDPLAEGVLILCFGKTAKFSNILTSLEKKYSAILKLDESTDTLDQEGIIQKTGNLDNLSDDQIINTINDFIGNIVQYPPMYSAVKYKGKPLYSYARGGVMVKRESREVFIKNITVDKVELPFVHFRVTCSKGTYIRTLCDDVGEKLGCYGHLYKLTRTAIGDFRIQDSISMDDIPQQVEKNEIEKFLIPPEKALYFLDSIVVNEKTKTKLLNGQKVLFPSFPENNPKNFHSKLHKIIDNNENLICLASLYENTDLNLFTIQPKIVIYNNNMVKS